MGEPCRVPRNRREICVCSGPEVEGGQAKQRISGLPFGTEKVGRGPARQMQGMPWGRLDQIFLHEGKGRGPRTIGLAWQPCIPKRFRSEDFYPSAIWAQTLDAHAQAVVLSSPGAFAKMKLRSRPTSVRRPGLPHRQPSGGHSLPSGSTGVRRGHQHLNEANLHAHLGLNPLLLRSLPHSQDHAGQTVTQTDCVSASVWLVSLPCALRPPQTHPSLPLVFS